MENSGYFFAAFAIVWAFVFIYALVLVARQRRLKQEVESIKEMLGKNEGINTSFTINNKRLKK